jgi:hypothetical protein
VKEFVLVEFLASYPDESELLLSKLKNLRNEDFIPIREEDEFDDNDGDRLEWIRVTGKISSMYASVIKLQDSFLAERMRISYIPEDLKNKYRS